MAALSMSSSEHLRLVARLIACATLPAQGAGGGCGSCGGCGGSRDGSRGGRARLTLRRCEMDLMGLPERCVAAGTPGEVLSK
jgi:hypothetical protein